MKTVRDCLLIDDDADDQEIFLICIHEVDPDINCVMANSGVEAIAMLMADKEFRPEFIFVDVNMPKMNGVECLKRLKAIEHLKNSKILMYSTTTESLGIQASINLGAEDFIVKPAKTTDLILELTRILITAPKLNS